MDINMLISKETDLPVRSSLIAWTEFIALCDCPVELVQELIDLGWVRPAQSAHQADLYSHGDVYRIRKLRRICADFDLNLTGGAIIVDLLGRIHELERKLQEMEGLIR